MNNLLIAKSTKIRLNILKSNMPHALLITGATGMGKKTIANALARELTKPANITVIEPDEKQTISIETVRNLYRATRSRKQHIQIIIIDHAECLGSEAQNAFLKLLEEPPAHVRFILTAPVHTMLLPTIASRVQTVHLQPVPHDTLQHALQQHNITGQDAAQILFIAHGRPGIFMQLIASPKFFAEYKECMQTAKKIINATQYDKLQHVPTLAKQKDTAIMLLDAVARILYLNIMHSPTQQSINFANAVDITLQRLAQNGNTRAQLTALFAR